MPDLSGVVAGDVLVAADDHRNVHTFRTVSRVARRYLYLEAPWGEEAVDRATGRSHDTHPEYVAYTKQQWETHSEALRAHTVIAAAGVAHRIGGPLPWDDDDVVAFAAWLQERGLVP